MLKEAKIIIEETDTFYDMYSRNCHTRTFINCIIHNNGVIHIDAVLDLCKIIENQQKEITDLVQNKVQRQYIVATEETIEKIKKDIEDAERNES